VSARRSRSIPSCASATSAICAARLRGPRLRPVRTGYVPPGGESWEELHERVDRMWDRLAPRAGGLDGDLVIVTHGLVCHSLVSRRIDLGRRHAHAGPVGNTSITILDAAPPWRMRLLGCIAHLDEDLARIARERSGISAIGP
jgi:probable phosphoglycerate mutase